MNRREALTTMASALAAFVLPVRRREIDLMQFCARNEDSRWNLTLPYELDAYTYASDKHVCVRVRPMAGDRIDRRGNVPPFASLSWNHDDLRGWRELPKLDALMAADSCCISCHGTGYTGAAISSECERCQGTGSIWVGSNYALAHPRLCRQCEGLGIQPPPGVAKCSTCDGKAIGTFPAVVNLAGAYYDADLYKKAQKLGCEYIQDNWHLNRQHPLLKFRFDGGLGLLMAIETEAAKRRISSTSIIKGGNRDID